MYFFQVSGERGGISWTCSGFFRHFLLEIFLSLATKGNTSQRIAVRSFAHWALSCSLFVSGLILFGSRFHLSPQSLGARCLKSVTWQVARTLASRSDCGRYSSSWELCSSFTFSARPTFAGRICFAESLVILRSYYLCLRYASCRRFRERFALQLIKICPWNKRKPISFRGLSFCPFCTKD